MTFALSPELVAIGGMFLTMVGGFFYFGVNFGSRLGKLEGVVSSMKEDFNRRLSIIEGTLAIAGNSPLKQTVAGQKIFDDTNGKQLVDENYEKLSQFVKDKEVFDSYGVQEQSIAAIAEVIPTESMSILREYAYEHGWKIDQVCEVLGIYLRDLIINERIRNG